MSMLMLRIQLQLLPFTVTRTVEMFESKHKEENYLT